MSDAAIKKEILGPIELIKESLDIFFKKNNFAYLIKVTLLVIVVELLPIVATILPIVLIAIMAKNGSENGVALALLVILAFLGGIITIITFLWASIVSIRAAQNAISGKIGPVSEVLKESWSGMIGSFFLLQILVGLILFVGYILFIIPGIIFSVWFAFSTYFLILENKGIMDSISASKALVKGYFWTVLGYTLLYGFIVAVVMAVLNTIIPLAGSVISSLFTTYFVIFPLLLFRELKKAKA